VTLQIVLYLLAGIGVITVLAILGFLMLCYLASREGRGELIRTGKVTAVSSQSGYCEVRSGCSEYIVGGCPRDLNVGDAIFFDWYGEKFVSKQDTPETKT
jgi:hypothetical protein